MTLFARRYRVSKVIGVTKVLDGSPHLRLDWTSCLGLVKPLHKIIAPASNCQCGHPTCNSKLSARNMLAPYLKMSARSLWGSHAKWYGGAKKGRTFTNAIT
jgi:hypothetical protein